MITTNIPWWLILLGFAFGAMLSWEQFWKRATVQHKLAVSWSAMAAASLAALTISYVTGNWAWCVLICPLALIPLLYLWPHFGEDVKDLLPIRSA